MRCPTVKASWIGCVACQKQLRKAIMEVLESGDWVRDPSLVLTFFERLGSLAPFLDDDGISILLSRHKCHSTQAHCEREMKRNECH